MISLDSTGCGYHLKQCGPTGTYIAAITECPGLGKAAQGNYCLIAAAPEMLAALKWASDYLSGWPRDDLQRHCREAVKAAIAKAEGRVS
jgi:hypothetical protein